MACDKSPRESHLRFEVKNGPRFAGAGYLAADAPHNRDESFYESRIGGRQLSIGEVNGILEPRSKDVRAEGRRDRRHREMLCRRAYDPPGNVGVPAKTLT